MLSTLALPQWSAASNAASARSDKGTIIVAQNDDPRQKGEAKGKQGTQPKGGQPGGQPPQRGQQQQQGGQPPQRGQQQQQGGQPPQRGQQQQQGGQPPQG